MVRYAALPTRPDHTLAQRLLRDRAAGVLAFGIRGGRAAGERFLDGLQLITRLVNIGNAKSLATHPASTTRRQISASQLEAAGVREDMVRISVGTEHIDDLLADIDQALRGAQLRAAA